MIDQSNRAGKIELEWILMDLPMESGERWPQRSLLKRARFHHLSKWQIWQNGSTFSVADTQWKVIDFRLKILIYCGQKLQRNRWAAASKLIVWEVECVDSTTNCLALVDENMRNKLRHFVFKLVWHSFEIQWRRQSIIVVVLNFEQSTAEKKGWRRINVGRLRRDTKLIKFTPNS